MHPHFALAIYDSRFTISGSLFPFRLFAVYCLLYASSTMNMHAARTALNQDPELREWVENWLKEKERNANQALTVEEFEKHWRYVRPERMHEGAVEALTAHAETVNRKPRL